MNRMPRRNLPGVRGFVAPTDQSWYQFLRARPHLDEVNFWRPGAGAFGRLRPGEKVRSSAEGAARCNRRLRTVRSLRPPTPVDGVGHFSGQGGVSINRWARIARLAGRPRAIRTRSSDWLVCSIAFPTPSSHQTTGFQFLQTGSATSSAGAGTTWRVATVERFGSGASSRPWRIPRQPMSGPLRQPGSCGMGCLRSSHRGSARAASVSPSSMRTAMRAPSLPSTPCPS